MQSEQQNIITPSKKSQSGVKKDKKTVSKNTETINQQVNEIKTSTPAPVVEVKTENKLETKTVSSTEVLENTSEVAIVQDLELTSILENLNNISDKLLEYSKYFKDNVLSKDERNKVEIGFKKLTKASSSLTQSYNEYLSKQMSLLEKNIGNKSGGNKKVTDKEKSAIHKKHNVHGFLLNFLKLEPNTLVSRSQALTSITGYVKEEKIKNPDIIVANDKRKFKLIGDLKQLFDGIEGVMKSKNLLKDTVMPTEIKYTQIMEYMTHCFIKSDELVV
jgi:hypothetical protein